MNSPKCFNNVDLNEWEKEKVKDRKVKENIREHLEKEKEKELTIKRKHNTEKLSRIFCENIYSRVDTVKNTENDNLHTICSKLNNLFKSNNKCETEFRTLDMYSQRSKRKLLLSEKKCRLEEGLAFPSEIIQFKKNKFVRCSCKDNINLLSIEKVVDIHLIEGKMDRIRKACEKKTNVPMSTLEITILPTEKEIKIIEKNFKTLVSAKQNFQTKYSDKYKENLVTEEENNLIFYGFNGENSYSDLTENRLKITKTIERLKNENDEEKRLDYLIRLLEEIQGKSMYKE